MKCYVYTDDEVDRAFEGIEAPDLACPSTLEVVIDACQADVFFVPRQVGILEMRHPARIKGVLSSLARLPHWHKYERRHFFYMHSDEDAPVGTQAIVFRWSVNEHSKDPRTVAMPAPVDDFGQMAEADYVALPFHVCFVGYGEDPKGIRPACIAALQQCGKLNSYLDVIGKHYGSYEETPLGEKRRTAFINGLMQSRLVLAPRGAGQHSYRFFEAMSAGRIPVLVADDYERPFADYVNYSLCSFQVAEARAAQVDQEILLINARCRPENCMTAMAMKAREYWEKYLAPARWDEMTLRYLETML